ncbi:hypothetical protein BGT96224_A20642 [Blumeria graminis f. sp. tritici 96224]|nr:hypothetical protein BGT96224_A20642 [Blumeria graminis f. sp. tritici 96224]
MILCVYALLYAEFKYHDNRPVHGKESDPSLVILGGDSKASFYGAFQAPSDGHFPAADANSDIFSTEEIDGSETTKIVAYCSPTLSSMEIIGSLVRDLPRLLRTQNIISDLTPQSEQECWNMIKKDWYNSFDAASSSGARELNEKNGAFLLSILRHDFKTSEELDIRLRQKSWRKKAVDQFFGAPSCESDDIDKLNQLMAEINHMKMYLPGGTYC